MHRNRNSSLVYNNFKKFFNSVNFYSAISIVFLIMACTNCILYEKYNNSTLTPALTPETGSTIVWSIDQSPIYINSVFYVEYNQILEIEPGVEIKFSETGGLAIYGAILAIGTADTPVSFTKQESITNWQGMINVYPNTEKSQFTYCIFEYASSSEYDGNINLFGSAIFSNCLFQNNHPSMGVITYRDGSYGLIENSIFQNNTCEMFHQYSYEIGIVDLGWAWGLDKFSAIIKQNVIFNNLGYGIDISTEWPSSRVYIYNNIIVNNSGDICGTMFFNFVHRGYNNVWNNDLAYYLSYLEPTDLSVDPRFVDPLSGDFTLTLDSPCLYAGMDFEHMGIQGHVNLAPEIKIEPFQDWYFVSDPFFINATQTWDPEYDPLLCTLEWIPDMNVSTEIIAPLLKRITILDSGNYTLRIHLSDASHMNITDYLLEILPLPETVVPILNSPDFSNGSSLSSHYIHLNWAPLPFIDEFYVYRSNQFITTINTSVELIAICTELSYIDYLDSEGMFYYTIMGYNSTFTTEFSNNLYFLIEFEIRANYFFPITPYQNKEYHYPNGNLYWGYPALFDIDIWHFNIHIGQSSSNLQKIGESEFWANYQSGSQYSRFYVSLNAYTTYFWQVELENELNSTVIRSPLWSFKTAFMPNARSLEFIYISQLNTPYVSGLTYNNSGFWISYESTTNMEYYNSDAISNQFSVISDIKNLMAYTHDSNYESYPISDLSYNPTTNQVLFLLRTYAGGYSMGSINGQTHSLDPLFFNYYGEGLGYYNSSILVSSSSWEGRVGINDLWETREIYDFGWMTDIQGIGVDAYQNIWISTNNNIYRTRLIYNSSNNCYSLIITNRYITNILGSHPNIESIEDLCFINDTLYIVYRDSSQNSYIACVMQTQLDPVTLLSPTYLAHINTNSVSFSWTPEPYAKEYRIEIYDSSDLEIPLFSAFSNVSSINSFFIPSDGTYFWRVAGRDLSNNYGAWTKFSEFIIDTIPPDTPILQSPIDLFWTNSSTLQLKWDIIADAFRYQVQIAYDLNFSNLRHDLTTMSNVHTVSNLIERIYYWQVRAIDMAGNYGNWSESRSFVLDLPPEQVILIAPNHHVITNLIFHTFFWQSVPDGNNYQFQLGINMSFKDPIVDLWIGNVSSLNFNISTGDGFYYWRVRGRDIAGNIGSWSEIYELQLDTIPPDQVILSYPLNNLTLSLSEITFSWNTLSDAQSYQIQISHSPSFSDLLLNSTLADQTLYFTNFVNNTTYYWRVRACDDAGNWGEWSSFGSFFIIITTSTTFPTNSTTIENPFSNISIAGYSCIFLIISIISVSIISGIRIKKNTKWKIINNRQF